MIITAYGNAVPFTNTNNRISDELFPPFGEPNHRWFLRFPLTSRLLPNRPHTPVPRLSYRHS
jgi:hypothetical protein